MREREETIITECSEWLVAWLAVHCPPSPSPLLFLPLSAILLPFLRIVRRISFGVAAAVSASVAEPLARSLAQVPRCLGGSLAAFPRPPGDFKCNWNAEICCFIFISQSRSRSQLGRIHRSDFTVALSFAQALNRNSFVSGFEPFRSSLAGCLLGRISSTCP